MNLKYFSIFFLLINIYAINELKAQSIVTDLAQLDFGEVMYEEEKTLPLLVTNTTEQTIRIIDIQFFDTFLSPAFFSDIHSFDLAPNNSKEIQVSFAPLHNIDHNTELFIVTENRGAFSVDLIGQGRYDNPYYNVTNNLSEEALKDALTQKLNNNTYSLSYNEARDEMYMYLDNHKTNTIGANTNTIEGVYTGEIASGYNSRSELQSNFNFNCEHTWPQSYGASGSPMKSDIHHLFPTKNSANSVRGNLRFGIVNEPTWEVGGSKKNSVRFEPRDNQKGISARAMLYFIIRYQNNSDLNLSWFTLQEDILKEWSNNFPPEEQEIWRNQEIYNLQNNRNPFVDYPQLVDRISYFSIESENEVEKIHPSTEWVDFGLIEANQSVEYQVAIYNDGTETVDLSNFSISNAPEIELVLPENENMELAAGEDYSFTLNLANASGERIVGSLNFETDIPNQASIQIPIYANHTMGIDDWEIENWLESVELYPNPAKDFINIRFAKSTNEMVEIAVYNSSGQLITEINTQQAQHFLPLKEFNTGVYFMQLKSNEQVGVKTFAIQR